MKRFFMRAGSVLLLAAVLFCGASCGVLRGGAETGTGKYAGVSVTESERDSSLSETAHRAYAYTMFDCAGRGETVSVTLSGCNPGERAVCRMKTSSGWSSAKGLGLGTADENGRITWTWRISAGVKTGDGFRVYLISEDGGLIADFPFRVVDGQESGTETECGTEAEQPSETECGTEPETAPDPETETEPVRETEKGTETEAETKRPPQTETESRTETGSSAGTDRPEETTGETETDRTSVSYRTETLPGGMTVTVFDQAERGAKVTLRLTGAVPGATYTCRMLCKSGASSSKGLGQAVADANGVVTWTWRIGTRLATSFQPTVEVSGKGIDGTFRFRFTVLPKSE